jgi:hypothetical protein
LLSPEFETNAGGTAGLPRTTADTISAGIVSQKRRFSNVTPERLHETEKAPGRQAGI